MDIVAECRLILSQAKPANSNRQPCGCNVRLAPQERVDALLARLDGQPPRLRTFERSTGRVDRVVLHPAPWLRAMLKDAP